MVFRADAGKPSRQRGRDWLASGDRSMAVKKGADAWRELLAALEEDVVPRPWNENDLGSRENLGRHLGVRGSHEAVRGSVNHKRWC
jgi:hypothetical protein